MTWKLLKDEFTIDDIGARLLANLAKGIYSHEAVLREYVQNACDSYAELDEFPELPTIHIRVIDETTITVQDSGIGMDERHIRECKKIAVSAKSSHHHSLTGFRGIGIWAGFQACDRLEIETTKKGNKHRYRLQIDFSKILEHVDEDINIKTLLDDRFSISVEDAPAADHYTIVKLVGLRGDYQKLTDLDELKRIVSQHLPCKIAPTFAHAKKVSKFLQNIDGYQEFPILVNGGEVFKAFPADLGDPQFEALKYNGEVFAKCWYCTDTKSITARGNEYRSFRLRIRNFAVGPVGIYDDEDGASYGIVNNVKLGSRAHLNWHVGEVHIIHPDIRPDTPRSSLELDQLSRRAIELIREFYEDRITDSRALSQFNTCESRLKASEAAIQSPESITPEEATVLQECLEEQESCTTGRRSNDKVKSKLRDLLNESTMKKRRQSALRALPAITKRLAQSAASGKPTQSETAKTKESKGSKKKEETATTATVPSVDFEAVLSDIIAVLEAKLAEGDEVVTELGEAITKIFVQYGLIDADE